VIGHQWYWSYEYNDLVTLQSYSGAAQLAGFRVANKEIFLNSFTIASAWNQLAGFSVANKEIFLNSFTASAWNDFEALKAGELKKNVEFLTGNIEFDSYMRQESDLQPGELRLYETDFPLVLPKFTHIRFMITADDVIHSWSVPALGIKVDAVPGRINHAHTYIKYSGIFYGQCSELCGVNHGFMPIQILVFEPQLYYDYLRLLLLSK
jgi:heme/copper-type cytochrome/quinol oxidase subunit 2